MLALLLAMAATPVTNWLAGDGKRDGEKDLHKNEVVFVAKLSDWKNDVWLEDTRPPRDEPRLKLGQRLVLQSGLIEVTYLTGARVVIEGPAEFVVGRMKDEGGRRKKEEGESEGHPSSLIPHPSNAGFLRLGKLVARVDGEKAQGFTIETPSASIEDLGTEFGIVIREGGRGQVVVLDGDVEVFTVDSAGRKTQRLRLAKDEGANIPAGDGRIQRIAKVESSVLASFARNIGTPPDTATPTDAELLFTEHTGRPGATYTGTAGARFETSDSPLPVTHLGFFDFGQDGLEKPHRVGIWHVESGSLIVNVTVPAGTEALLAHEYRWVKLLSPVKLEPSTKYILAAEVFSTKEDLWRVHTGTVSWNSRFTQPDSRHNCPIDNGGPWPGMPTRDYNGTVFGPANLAFVPAESTKEE